MTIGLVNNIIPFSSVDGPGNRTSIFLQGCNFNCKYCHNPETINNCLACGNCLSKCPSSALSKISNEILWNKDLCTNCDNCIKSCKNCSSPKIMKYSSKELINEITKYKSFIQGITVSGGECTLQEEFLVDLFTEAKKLNLTCFVDSNGGKKFRDMPILCKVMDKVMLDVKSFNNFKHFELTGKSNDTVLDNLAYLTEIDKLFEVRTVVVPDLLDNIETVSKVSEFLGTTNKNIRYKLIKYRPLGVRENLISAKVPSTDFMIELKNIALSNGCIDVVIV